MKKNLLLVSISIIFLQTSAIFAQSSWKLCPLPVTADVRDIVLSAPGVILAGTSDGVYWSDDLGESWKNGSGNLSNKNIQAIAALAFGRLVVATDDGIYLSSDRGLSWQPAATPLFAKQINEFETDYELAVYAATNDGVWFSSDNGNTWKAMGLQGIELLSIGVGVNGEFLAGAARTGNDGIYQTTDYGINWNRINSDIMGVNAVDISPFGYFAGTYSHNPFKSNVLRKGFDNQPWQESGLINSSVSCFTYAVYPDMFAGIQQSSIWPDTTSAIGVQHSSDAGQTWTAYNEGLTNTDVHSLYIFWDNLFAGTSTGIYKRIFNAVTKVDNHTAEKNLQLQWNSVENSYKLISENRIAKLNWSLYDLFGKNISSGIESDFKEKVISLQNCSSGIYLLNVNSGEFNKSFQLLSLH